MANVDLQAQELESFYRRYIAAFNRDELTELAELFSYPWGSVGGKRGMVVIKDQAEFMRTMGKSKAALRSRGWARTGIGATHAWPTADDMALLMADFTRYREDGTELARGRACYGVRRDPGGWKIITLMEVTAPYLGPGDLPR